jgi:hypothetical protein
MSYAQVWTVIALGFACRAIDAWERIGTSHEEPFDVTPRDA